MNTLLKTIFILLIGLAISWQAGAAEPVTEADCNKLDASSLSTHKPQDRKQFEELSNASKKSAISAAAQEPEGIVADIKRDILGLVSLEQSDTAMGANEMMITFADQRIRGAERYLCWMDFAAQRPHSFSPDEHALFLESARNAARLLDQAMAQNVGRETEALAQFIKQNRNNEHALSLALASPYATPELLNYVAHNANLALTIVIASNKNCAADTLASIYRAQTGPRLWFSLAEHAHTPPDILRDIFTRSARPINTGVGMALAKNPATPVDILQELSDSKNKYVLQSLLGNPNLDCAILQRVNQTVSVKYPDSLTAKQATMRRSELSCRN